MAIGLNLITSGTSGSSTTHNTASVTPTANALQLLYVETMADATTVTTVDGSNNGLTWTLLARNGGGDTGNINWSGTKVVSLFRALTNSPSTGVSQFTHSPASNSAWTWVEFTGVDTTGTNGSGAAVQCAYNAVYGGQTSITVTLNAFGDVNNATYGTFATEDSSTPTVGSGFTQAYSFGVGGAGGSMMTEYKLANDTSVDATFATGTNLQGFAVEVKVAGVAPPTDTFTAAWSSQGTILLPGRPRMVPSGPYPGPRIP